MPSANLFDLSGRAAVVTGGIGRGIALGLAQAGAAVAFWRVMRRRTNASLASFMHWELLP
jgi:NAD(P)-dependent dehydrogenase (short-subunit alcohol dehydrogenase family)